MDIVIIGGGLAAAKAATALREGGHDGSVTVVAGEDRTPYERPPLSKDYLLGESELDDAAVQPAAWYGEHDVRLITGVRATSIDPDAHQVRLADGEVLGFDKLILATGADPAVPSSIAGAEEAIYLRNADDAERLKRAFADGESIAIVGGSWIGLEVAAAARQNDVATTVIMAEDVPLAAVMGERIGRYFAELHLRHGVTFHAGARVDAVTGGGPEGLERGSVNLRTAAGETEVVEADAVVLATGVSPATELADAAGLLVDDGIVTDEHFETSHPDVYAIGDVARNRHTGLGEASRIEHWDDASRQGEAVAKVLLGQDVVYDWEPYFFTDQYDLGMEYVGRGSGDHDVVVRGSLDDGEFIAIWLHDGVVTAGMNVNIWDVNDDLRALLGRRIDPDRLADPAIELSDL